MKKRGNKKDTVTRVAAGIGGAASMVATNAMSVFASTGVSEIDTGMNGIKTIAIGIVSIIGIVALVKGAMDLGTGISQRDNSGITTGAGEIAGGLVMAAVGAVIAFLGY